MAARFFLQVINRVIALGERAKWGSSDDTASSSGGGSGGNGSPARERWVQFGAVYSSRVSVEQGPPDSGAAATSSTPGGTQQPAAVGINGAAPSLSAAARGGGGSRLLRDYLALPIDQYSLLDPKWISRWACRGPQEST